MIDIAQMKFTTGELAGSDLARQIDEGECICQMHAAADPECPAVVWSQYGLVASNEVVVTARCADLGYYIRAASMVAHPPMAERIYGMDVLDGQLGLRLGERLWELHGAALRAHAANQAGEGAASLDGAE
ncbi:hypothetical protein [Sinimarinibacterium flocculans]|uniref:hypothetical protein n=1 Tax=Sinimarinibacterium flocculans TaxID=985250 RepID=UPI002492BCB2|nr:hypothetical protein [Sinimarinibacterium flocculans]